MVLEDDDGGSSPVSPQTLQTVFHKLKDNIRCVVLNSCYSEAQAKAIAQSIDCVIGMSSAVCDAAAIAFAASFYQALGFGRSVHTAFDLACLEVALLGIPGEHTPKLHTAPGIDADSVYLTGRPELWCEFELDKSLKPTRNVDGYKIRAFVKNAPDGTLSVVYQLNDESYRDDEEEFVEIPNDGRAGFETFFGSEGDFEIRAVIWYEKIGQGMKTRLAAALERSHGKNQEEGIGRALKSIKNN